MSSFNSFIPIFKIPMPSDYYNASNMYILATFVVCCLVMLFAISECKYVIDTYQHIESNNPIINNIGFITAVVIFFTAYMTYDILVNFFQYNDIQSQVISSIQNNIMTGKSNKYIIVKPYKKVIAIEKNNELYAYIKSNDESVTNKHSQKSFTIPDTKLLIKYSDGTQESFTNEKTSIISKPSHEKKTMTINVYTVKLTNTGMHYMSLDMINTYTGRRAVITSYAKIKSINWQTVN